MRFPILLVDRFFPGWGWLEIMALAVYAAWVGARMSDPGRSPAIRSRIWALFSLIFFLQLGLGLAGIGELLMTGALHLPVPAVIVAGPIYRGGGYLMPILFAVTLVLVGPAWCSHLCYIGAWDDALSRFCWRSGALPAWARHGRWFTLAAVALAALLLRLLHESAAPGRAGHCRDRRCLCPGRGPARCDPRGRTLPDPAGSTVFIRGGAGWRSWRWRPMPPVLDRRPLPRAPAEAARRLFLVLVVSLQAVFPGVARM